MYSLRPALRELRSICEYNIQHKIRADRRTDTTTAQARGPRFFRCVFLRPRPRPRTSHPHPGAGAGDGAGAAVWVFGIGIGAADAAMGEGRAFAGLDPQSTCTILFLPYCLLYSVNTLYSPPYSPRPPIHVLIHVFTATLAVFTI